MITHDMVHERTIHRLLKRQVQRYGNRTFFHYKQQAFGYGDLDRESDRVAAGLQSLGWGRVTRFPS